MERRRATGTLAWLLGVMVCAASVGVHWRATRNGFVGFDDQAYVTENVQVKAGLTWAGVKWAMTSGKEANWHPLTWISHMMDVELWGDDARGHHGMSVVMHGVNGGLVVVLLWMLTGWAWRSAGAGALWALHPLRVESVAWASERKDVLSMMLGVGALMSCVGWARRGGRWRMGRTAVLLGLGLMSKPMLVSLPVLMVMLDAWPLGRWRGSVGWADADGGVLERREERRTLVQLILEKWVLILMAGASCVVTYWVQHEGGAMQRMGHTGLGERALNAGSSVWVYVRQTVWPMEMAVLYPWRSEGMWERGAWGWGLAAVVCAGAWVMRKRAGGLLSGWGWFLASLIPVLGFVQVGMQAHADRYTYLPGVGLVMMVMLGLTSLAGRSVVARVMWSVGVVCACAGMSVMTVKQTGYWRDTGTLFGRALEVTSDNWVAHERHAYWLEGQGRLEEAAAAYRETVRIQPRYATGYNNMGKALFLLGRRREAEEAFARAVRLTPEAWESQMSLAEVMWARGAKEEAVKHYEAAVSVKGEKPAGAMSIGWMRLGQWELMGGDLGSAEERLREAVRLDGGNARAAQLLQEVQRQQATGQGSQGKRVEQ